MPERGWKSAFATAHDLHPAAFPETGLQPAEVLLRFGRTFRAGAEHSAARTIRRRLRIAHQNALRIRDPDVERYRNIRRKGPVDDFPGQINDVIPFDAAPVIVDLSSAPVFVGEQHLSDEEGRQLRDAHRLAVVRLERIRLFFFRSSIAEIPRSRLFSKATVTLLAAVA